MGDFSSYAEQGLQFGRTVPYEITELLNADGTHPVLHVEHLGTANASFLEEVIARASAADAEPKDGGGTGVMHADGVNREAIIKHCARRIERVFFSDGTQATDADIPAFIRSLPVKALGRLMRFLVEENNFCKYPIAEKPAVLAEK